MSKLKDAVDGEAHWDSKVFRADIKVESLLHLGQEVLATILVIPGPTLSK